MEAADRGVVGDAVVVIADAPPLLKKLRVARLRLTLKNSSISVEEASTSVVTISTICIGLKMFNM